MRIRRNSRKAHGAGYSYSNSANDLFHEKIYEDNSRLETLVDALLANKVASIDSGPFKINFVEQKQSQEYTFVLVTIQSSHRNIGCSSLGKSACVP